MAASCSIHLAEIANQSADWDTALRTFQTIVENYPEPQYAFYVSKATQAIEQFSSALPVSLSSHDSLVR
jgi:outer membrane protein assembly factor BamD (BamD/ComL family)